MDPQKLGNSPGAGPNVVTDIVSLKSEQTIQNEMRGVLGRVSAGPAGRILDCTDPREIRA